MVKIHLRRGDNVRVIAGKFKGSEGKIMAVFPEKSRVIVDSINVIKKAQKPTQDNPRGGFAEREAPIHISNVQLLDPRTGALTRVRYKLENGHKSRVSVKSGAALDE